MTHPKKIWHYTEDKGWHQMTMEAIDANHAVAVDPKIWSFENPNASALESPIMGADGADEGSDGIFGEAPSTSERSESEKGGA